MGNQVASNKVIVFQSLDEEYGVPIQYVVSIEKLQFIEAVPNMPLYMYGVLKNTSTIIPILDGNQILHGYDTKTEITDKTRVMVLQTDLLTFGMIVDNTIEITEIQNNTVQQIEWLQNNSSLLGIAVLDSRLLILIEPVKLLSSVELLEVNGSLSALL